MRTPMQPTAPGMEWARRFAQAAREIAAASGAEETLHLIAHYATGVAGCEWAAVVRAVESATPVVAATNGASVDVITALQASGGGGPTWAAIRECRSVYVPDVASEGRWPAHMSELLATTSVRSILAICLELDGELLGALTLYANRPDAFPPTTQDLVAVYAEHAAIALERENTNTRLDNLREALRSNRQIGVAVGILVERHKITTEQAFDLLRTASQHSHRKLRDLAADLTFTGELIADPPRPPTGG